MKWLLIMFSMLRPFFSVGSETTNPVKEIKDMIKANAAKVIALMVVASAFATIFAGGIILFAVDIGAQLDQNGYIYFSAMMGMGLLLSAISALTVGFTLRSLQPHRQFKKRETLSTSTVGTVHPLQDALALLVLDFIKEREYKRNQEPLYSRTEDSEITPVNEMRH